MKKIIALALTLISIQITYAQNLSIKDSLINYFDKQIDKLDPIEGIWVLNVEGTLYRNDSVIGNHFEEFRSEWAIKKDNENRFKVLNIDGAENEEHSTDFEAFFEKTAINGLYNYSCHFHFPDWIGRSTARLTDDVILEYGYFTSDIWIKEIYKGAFGKNVKQYWKFTWYKKYPLVKTEPDIYYSDWKTNGSGFFINKNGYIATNYHVVVDAKLVDVKYKLNEHWHEYKAKVISTDKINDLAIIKIISPDFRSLKKIPYNIRTTESEVGTKVFSIGYQSLMDIENNINFYDGRISAHSGYKGNPSVYQTTVPFLRGNSGGPLFDKEGNVVAVITGALSPAVSDNVSYATKAKHLNALISEIPIEKVKNQNDKNMIELANMLTPFVVYIKSQ